MTIFIELTSAYTGFPVYANVDRINWYSKAVPGAGSNASAFVAFNNETEEDSGGLYVQETADNITKMLREAR